MVHLMCRPSERDSNMEKEELLQKRFQELATAAQRRDRVMFSDFLNLNEQNILHQQLHYLNQLFYMVKLHLLKIQIIL